MKDRITTIVAACLIAIVISAMLMSIIIDCHASNEKNGMRSVVRPVPRLERYYLNEIDTYHPEDIEAAREFCAKVNEELRAEGYEPN